MKKVVSLALSALLVLSLAACSSSNTTSTAASSAATSDAASSEESTSDSSTSTASSAADSTTAEPDIQFDESFQPQTIADNDTCTIILQSVGYDDDYGYYWTVDFQNKTDDKTLCAITSSSSLKRFIVALIYKTRAPSSWMGLLSCSWRCISFCARGILW